MAAYLDEFPNEQTFKHGQPSKRRRTEPLVDRAGHPGRARVISRSNNYQNPLLEIETTVVKFKLRRVRQNGDLLRTLKSGSQQSRNAIGDHWTLLDGNGRSLRDIAGEYPRFELADYFFRLTPEYSEMLFQQENVADLAFVEHWSRIRDSATSNKWLHDMVSTLLVIKNPDGTWWRLASVLLKGEDWYARSPAKETISIL